MNTPVLCGNVMRPSRWRAYLNRHNRVMLLPPLKGEEMWWW